MPQSETLVYALSLRAAGMEEAALALGLRAGDVLEAINGRPFRSDEAALRARFAARAGKPLALTFRRGVEPFVVLAETGRLGRWEPVPCPMQSPEPTAGWIDPMVLRNYEVVRSEGGVYDLYPAVPSMLAMIAPPLWLLQMRLWVQGATVVAALAAAAVVMPVLGAVVWAAAGVWVRQSAKAFLRADRAARGLRFDGLIATRGEAEAHATHLRRYPGDRYVFAPEMRVEEQTV